LHSKNKSQSGKYLPVFVLFAVAALMLAGSIIDMCEGCSGWGIINPFCQAGAVACVATWGTIHLIMQGLAVVLIIVGTVRLIRIK